MFVKIFFGEVTNQLKLTITRKKHEKWKKRKE